MLVIDENKLKIRAIAVPFVSLVVPVYNEEESIKLFINEVEKVLERKDLSYEILFINDGSSDNTLFQLFEYSRINHKIKIINLTRNFGKEAALTAGLDQAKGDVVVPIDVDLQDPPAVILNFIEQWRKGYDVVYGIRSHRKSDSFRKRLSSTWFYNLFNRVSNHKIPENAGDFRLIDQSVMRAIRQLPERNRFMKGLFSWVGFATTHINYERPARAAGNSKWNYWRLWNFALDGLTGFSTIPLRVWTYIGMFVSLISFFYALFIILRVSILGIDIPGYASLMTMVLFFGGVQLLSLGIMGEYIGRIFIEVKSRPIYIVDCVYQQGQAVNQTET